MSAASTLDVGDVDAERIGGDLREDGAMALALARGARGDDDLAGRRHANGRAFEGAEAGILDAGGHAEAEQLAARGAASAAPRRETRQRRSSPARGRARDGSRRCRRRSASRRALSAGDVGHLVGAHEAAAPHLLARQMPRWRAMRSARRSSTKATLGRDAPRTGDVGTRLVSTTSIETSSASSA